MLTNMIRPPIAGSFLVSPSLESGCEATVINSHALSTTHEVSCGPAYCVRQAGELDKTLQANGWTLESATPTGAAKPTVEWFVKLASGKEFQPNQPYSKSRDGADFNLNFWTAYSEPDPPATSEVLFCSSK